MSKIQEALRKIQADGSAKAKPQPAPEPEPVDIESTGTLGKIARELDDTGVLIQPEDGGLIVIDRDALRAEGYLAPRNQERRLADQYRFIKRPLLDNAAGRGAYRADDARRIMVTSALPGDGKTFNCINLALSMALEKDTSVLLVDADVAKPHISDLFGVADQSGLIELLKDDSISTGSLVMRTDVPGLRILPAGCPDEHATELLASRRMEQVVDELSQTYTDRIVIFDSPPLLITSEARVLASSMGQIAMVVRAGKTPQRAVIGALESLDESKAVNLILNEADSSTTTDGYGVYGYGYGYGKGRGAS